MECLLPKPLDYIFKLFGFMNSLLDYIFKLFGFMNSLLDYIFKLFGFMNSLLPVQHWQILASKQVSILPSSFQFQVPSSRIYISGSKFQDLHFRFLVPGFTFQVPSSRIYISGSISLIIFDSSFLPLRFYSFRCL